MNLLPTEYWEFDLPDLIRGVATAVFPGRAGIDPDIEIPGVGPSLPVRSGRVGIVLALKALGLPPGASVAVPLYCCPVVLRAIETSGYRAYFIEVDPDTYCISTADLATKSSTVDAVIAIHMFGNLCDIAAIRRAAPGKPVIEDCALALGSRFDSRAAGSLGDIAVFSFRSGKYISAGEGGAVFCSHPEIKTRISALIAGLPKPGPIDECVHVIKTYLRAKLRSRPLWGLIGHRLWSAYATKVSVKSQAPIVMTQTYETDRTVAIRRMSNLSSAIERQRSNADYYIQNSSVDSTLLCREQAGTFFNRMQFPLLFSTSAECEEFAAYLHNDLVGTSKPYKDIVAIASEYYGYRGGCPTAERVAGGVLTIPCNHALRPPDVERISSAMNRAWQRMSTRRTGIETPTVNVA